MRKHFEEVWRAMADLIVLALYFVFGFGVALLTDGRLHWTRDLGSPALDRMARSGQTAWGVFALAVAALSLWRPRQFGLTAVIALVCVRFYDFWHDDPRNYYFAGGQILFVALALRGSYRRAVRYGP